MTCDKNSNAVRVGMVVHFEIHGLQLTGKVASVDELQNRIEVQTEDGGSYNIEAYTAEVA